MHFTRCFRYVPILNLKKNRDFNHFTAISKYIVAKIVVKIICLLFCLTMMDYFTSNELFSSQQYGFRPNRSTELAALELMDRNIDIMNQNFCPINIYIDLCKAFDCLDHAILLSKLKYYGLNDNAIKLLKNYLSDRDQYVQLGNFKSQYHNISCGIPQGSVMGPLLFNIVIKVIEK